MKISFIGGGNIASAIIGGITKENYINKKNISVYDINSSVYEKYSQNGFNAVKTIEEAFMSDIIFLTIKPQFYPEVLSGMGDLKDKLIVTVAPGITVSTVKGYLDKSCKVIRTMPNTPLMVGEGMTVIASSDEVEKEKYDFVKSLFEKSGKVAIIKEELIDSAIAVSGSSPAYIYMMIDALKKGGMEKGIDEETSLFLAAQAVYGSAKMVMETKISPSTLKDMVCSPNGTTIRAVNDLEKNNFEEIIIHAMNECYLRAKEMQEGK